MATGKIKERVADAVAHSYYRPWYKRGWVKTIFVLLIISFILAIFMAIKVIGQLSHINKGEIFNPELGIWMTGEDYLASQKLAADILTDDDPWLGAEEPIVNVVVYESFGCPFCKEDQVNIKSMIERFSPIVRFTVRDFPTEGIHPGVFEAHLAASCAFEQDRYWEYGAKLFENQNDFKIADLKTYAKELSLDSKQFDECLNSQKYSQEIRQDYAEGVEFGVEGTPTYVINGNMLPGTISYDLWEQIIGYIVSSQK
ncbi:DsbA family protein [Patescibacteria group bacterium]|nr:DsbA family protein [Patescibacteria group bacterium]